MQIKIINTAATVLHMAYRMPGEVDAAAVNRGEATLPALMRTSFPPGESVHTLTAEQHGAFDKARKAPESVPAAWFGKGGPLSVEAVGEAVEVPEGAPVLEPENAGGGMVDGKGKGGGSSKGGK